MAFPHGLRALNHADFRLFFTAQMVALVGTWMQTVGQSWLVLQLTDSPLKLGLIGTLQFGPILVFSIVSGAIADRLPKRRLLIGTQTTLATQALLLALLVWSGHAQYYTLIWGGAFPIGSFMVGAVSEAWGVSRAFLASGAFGLTGTAALGVWWTMRAGRRPE